MIIGVFLFPYRLINLKKLMAFKTVTISLLLEIGAIKLF